MKILLVIAGLAIITSIVIRAIKAAKKVRRTPGRKVLAKDGGPLTDAEPSGRLTCFPTRNPITGEATRLGTLSDEAALKKAGLPVAHGISDFARIMGVSPGELYWLMSEDGNHYVPREIKRRGRRRLVFAPKPKMKACQRWILRNILDKVSPHSAAEGFRKGHGVLTHAGRHTGKFVVGTMDIHRFFDTVRSKRVYGIYRGFGYSEQAALALCLLTTRKGRLPQGAPTSPALANLVCRRLDARLTGLAKKFGAAYSRYADDMAFSGGEDMAKGYKRFRAHLSAIMRGEGFKLNPEKSRRMRSTSRQIITGVVVNKTVNIPRHKLRRLRAILHNAKIHGLNSQNRGNHTAWGESLRGQISFVSMIRPDRGRKLLKAFNEIKSEV